MLPRIKITLSYIAGFLTCLLALACYNEFIRWGQGSIFTSALLYGSRTVSEESFTHVSGAPMSIYASGKMDSIGCSVYRCLGNGTLRFPSGKSINFDIQSTIPKYKDDLPEMKSIDLDSNSNVLIDSSLIARIVANGKDEANIRCRGYYFISYIRLTNLKNFPDDGVLSIIVH